MKEFMAGNKDLFKKIKSDLTEIIHELISTRNKLFKTLDNLNLHSLAKNPDKFRAKDFGKMLKYSKIREHDKEFSIFEIWGIKRKSHTDKQYDEICRIYTHPTFNIICILKYVFLR